MEKSLDELFKVEQEKLKHFNDYKKDIRWALESWQLKTFFPSSLRYSFVVLLHIHVEQNLHKICELISQINKLPIKEKDLKGDIIERFVKYFDKFLSIKITEFTKWPKVIELSKIRNCIVHTGGEIDKSKDLKYLEDLIRKTDLLDSSSQKTLRRIIIKRDYCMILTAGMRDFFYDILKFLNFPISNDVNKN